MTENEIKNTKEWIEDFIETYALSNQETIEFKKAVACLEELQQYRAIGTVEEILNTFNAQQLKIASQHNELEEYRAIGTVKGYERAVESATENYKLYREYRTKVQNFEVIGTIEEFKALKEKQYDCTIKHLTNECSYKETGCSDCKGYWKIRKLLEKNVAKKSKEVHENEICIDFICPNCKEAVYGQPYRPNYCKHCGQKLDWQ